MKDLCVVILNYRRADLTIECLQSLRSEIDGQSSRTVVVIDNDSADRSADRIQDAIDTYGWSSWCRLVRSPFNGGFSAGNNLGVQTVDANYYLFLNSDTRMFEGTISGLLKVMHEEPGIGCLGPRLEEPDGRPHNSCFRYRTPISECLAAAQCGPLTKLLGQCVVAPDFTGERESPQWLSFACVMIRRETIEQVGPMDEEYFMYFEDIDYCRRICAAGWEIVHDPSVRVCHLSGGSSSVKQAKADRTRVPRYYYESRSRYFAKFYGGVAGLWMTNVLWHAGRCLSLLRELIQHKPRVACDRESRDIWANWFSPLQPPTRPEPSQSPLPAMVQSKVA